MTVFRAQDILYNLLYPCISIIGAIFMTRIPLVDPGDMNSEQLRQYSRFPSNLTRCLLLTDQRLSEAVPNLANALRASSMDAKIREAIVVRVAALQKSAYEQMQHSEQIRKVGWSEEEILAIISGDAKNLSYEIATILEFVSDVVNLGAVSNETFARVQKILSPRDIATSILIVGHYMMIARLTAIFEIDLDKDPDSWTHEH